MRTELSALLAALLIAHSAGAAETKARRHVSASVRGTLSDRWDVSDHQGRLWLSVSAFGNSVNFSGRPISGSLHGSGNWYSVSASGLSGQISRWGSGYDVRVTAPSRHIAFTVQVNGRPDGPRPPGLSVFSADASLNFSPVFDREYSVSGAIDEERFGDEGLALACLAAALVLKERPRGQGVPRTTFLRESAVLAPFLKTGFGR